MTDTCLELDVSIEKKVPLGIGRCITELELSEVYREGSGERGASASRFHFERRRIFLDSLSADFFQASN